MCSGRENKRHKRIFSLEIKTYTTIFGSRGSCVQYANMPIATTWRSSFVAWSTTFMILSLTTINTLWWASAASSAFRFAVSTAF